MDTFHAHTFALTLALVGIVIVIAALLSGLIERSGMPQVAVFLALGAMLGPAGLGLLDIRLDSPLLRVVATLSLALVLFTDAVSLDVKEARRHGGLALLVLGPGTMLSAALIGLAGWGLLGLSPAGATILGAALASTDPVLLRGFLTRRDIPGPTRQALRLESGLNDAVLLPVVLVAMAFLEPVTSQDKGKDWARLGIELFLLGPGAGVLVGLVGVATLDMVRRRIGVRRDYESLYSLGIAFTAFAGAEAVHGSGFLAAFAAGLTIAALDVELCDCFLDYGASTAELALLFTFVLFGSSLIWIGFTVADGPALLFALLSLLIRPVAFFASFVRTRIERQDKLLIAWFGPRGLSSLLLVLLPVFAGTQGSERLFALCCLVVLASVALHGGSLMLLGRIAPRRPRASETTPEAAVAEEPLTTPEIHPSGGSLAAPESIPEPQPDEQEARPFFRDSERISIDELRRLWEVGAPVVVLDVRTERAYSEADLVARGAIRISPDHAIEEARELHLSIESWLVAFCT